LLHKDLLLMVI